MLAYITTFFLDPAASGSGDTTQDYHEYDSKWSSSDPVTLATSTLGLTLHVKQLPADPVILSVDPSAPAVLVSCIHTCILYIHILLLL